MHSQGSPCRRQTESEILRSAPLGKLVLSMDVRVFSKELERNQKDVHLVKVGRDGEINITKFYPCQKTMEQRLRRSQQQHSKPHEKRCQDLQKATGSQISKEDIKITRKKISRFVNIILFLLHVFIYCVCVYTAYCSLHVGVRKKS